MIRAEAIRKFIINNVARHPDNIVDVTAKKFDVTRTTVHRHVTTLLQNGLLAKSGTTRQCRYFLANAKKKQLSLRRLPKLDEFTIWAQHFYDDFSGLSKNIYDICEYGFTEVLNNAFDHSEAKHIQIKTDLSNEAIEIEIADDGIGIFTKIQQYLHLQDKKEAILELSKGKFTTDSSHHSGEGLFFSSRLFDEFAIVANGLIYLRDNLQQEWLVETSKQKTLGTTVKLCIQKNSKRNMSELFQQYQNEDDLSFAKTEIIVELAKMQGERYIARSQAKRILRGLEKFQKIILDFKNVVAVGQGFADEVFRVFKLSHPSIEIQYINANEEVRFMLERSIPRK